jgi:hypothetical protein
MALKLRIFESTVRNLTCRVLLLSLLKRPVRRRQEPLASGRDSWRRLEELRRVLVTRGRSGREKRNPMPATGHCWRRQVTYEKAVVKIFICLPSRSERSSRQLGERRLGNGCRSTVTYSGSSLLKRPTLMFVKGHCPITRTD